MPVNEPPLTLKRAGELLKKAGLRKTVSRVHLLHCLASQEYPRTQAEIAEQLEPHGFDPSTVFRGLTDLTNSGLVVRIDAGDRLWRFELHDQNPDGSLAAGHHSHIVCCLCGRMKCVDSRLAAQIKVDVGDWIIEEYVIRGRCGPCRTDGNKPSNKQN